MPNMKALSHRIKKLWPMLKFFKSRLSHWIKKVMANVKVFQK